MILNLPPLGLTGFLFPTQSDTAYSAQRIWLAVGFTLGFIIGLLQSEKARVWVMIVAAIIALSCNIAIEVVTKFNISSYYRSYSISCAQQENDALAIENNTPAAVNHAENIPATVNHTPAASETTV